MAISKVVYGDETLIDISEDNVASTKLLSSAIAHGSDGATILGSIPTRAASDKTVSPGNEITISNGYYEKSFKVKAGPPSVTTLWTNPDTSAIFAAKTITLSDNYDNYDLIKVTYTNVKIATPKNITTAIFKTSEMPKWNQRWIKNGDESIRNCGGLCGMVHEESGASAKGVRYILTYNSSNVALSKNQLRFTAAYESNGNPNETYFNRYLIPISIEGIVLGFDI